MESDPDFDLSFHVRRMIAPSPGSFDYVLELARQAEMADFDRARPLWEVTIVEGLAGGEAALVGKFHHSLTDGVGGVDIAMNLFDLTREGTERGPVPVVPPASRAGALEGVRRSAQYDVGLARSLARTVVTSLPTTVGTVARRPVSSLRSAVGTVASVYRTVRPLTSTGSSLMKERRLVRRLGVHEVPLAQLKAAARVSGATVNDAFLAGVTGGLRRYHEHHGVAIGDLHVCMPVSLRTADDAAGGNRITLMRFDLPADVREPRERIRVTHRRAGFVRAEKSLPYTQLIAGALNLVPRWYIASILRNVDVLASDVTGIPVPVYIGGAKVLVQYPFGPTIGAGLNVTMMSYVDTCALGINADTGAIPDFDVLHACLVAGFEEVLSVGDRARGEAGARGVPGDRGLDRPFRVESRTGRHGAPAARAGSGGHASRPGSCRTDGAGRRAGRVLGLERAGDGGVAVGRCVGERVGLPVGVLVGVLGGAERARARHLRVRLCRPRSRRPCSPASAPPTVSSAPRPTPTRRSSASRSSTPARPRSSCPPSTSAASSPAPSSSSRHPRPPTRSGWSSASRPPTGPRPT